MRMTSRTRTISPEERLRRDRAAAQSLRAMYPRVASIRLEMDFEDPGAQPPASQAHVLHPPARAFFAFRCPYANCDGTIDLTSVAGDVVKQSEEEAVGEIECCGTRARGAQGRQPCGVRVRYLVSANYHPRGTPG